MEAILEASARIIRREGAEALNTNRIAEVAGVGVGTLYSYFPDKSAILIALARRMMAAGEVSAAAAVGADPSLSPVRALVREVLRQHDTDKPLRRAVMTVHIGRGHGGEHGASTQTAVAGIVERLTAEGAPPSSSLKLFVATRAVLGVARALLDEPEETLPPLDALEDELIDMLRGYLADPALTEPTGAAGSTPL